MAEIFHGSMAAPAYTWIVTLLMAGASCWFLSVVVEAKGLAILFTPFLVFGGLLSTYLLSSRGVVLATDKGVAVVLAAAVGIGVTLLALLVLYIIYARISDSISRNRIVSQALPDAPRPRTRAPAR